MPEKKKTQKNWEVAMRYDNMMNWLQENHSFTDFSSQKGSREAMNY